jgi:hypothetical protein
MPTFSDIPTELLPHIASYIPELRTLTIFIDELAFQSEKHYTSFVNDETAKALNSAFEFIAGVNHGESSVPVENFKQVMGHFISQLKVKRGKNSFKKRATWTKGSKECIRCLKKVHGRPIPEIWQQYYECRDYCKFCYREMASRFFGEEQFYQTTDMRGILTIPKGFTFNLDHQMTTASGGKVYFKKHIEDLIREYKIDNPLSKKRKASDDGEQEKKKPKKTNKV